MWVFYFILYGAYYIGGKFSIHMKTAFLSVFFFLPFLSYAQDYKSSVATEETDKVTTISNPSEDNIPVIDGNVMADPAWANIAAIVDFKQTQPSFGASPSEKTEIRICQSSSTLYISAVCFDSRPQDLVVADSRRDGPLDKTDAISFILDTYNDGQNGFIFGTNSIGIEYDAQVDNEGQGNFNSNRQQGGTIGGFNLNWDASWIVKTEVGDYGWSAEFAIPLNTLRFATGENQTWGINFRRNIRKTNEIVYWAPMPIGFDLKRLSLAGKINNMSLKSPKNLKVIPYVLGQSSKNFRTVPSEAETDVEVGGDIKYNLTPNLTLDLTYNTDFAQVEVDEQQVNLDRFNLFFPEKRPFFLENAGLFSVGSPGEVDLFFSRRIGIGSGGQQVPIIGGARLSGKINRTNVGFLSMFTDNVDEESIPRNNFTMGRVNHEFQGRSSIGGMFINKISVGDESDFFNRTMALDGKFGLGNKAQLSGFYSKTSTDGFDNNGHSFKTQAQYEWDSWNIRAGYTEVSEGFNPEVGFLLRSAFRKPEFLVLYHYRPKNKNSPLLELRPHISYRGYWNFEGFQETSFLHLDNHWEFKSGTEVHTGVNITKEGVVEDFTISNGIVIPKGVYDHAEAQIVFFTNRSKPLSISTRHVLGGFFGGKRYANTVTMYVRSGDKFASEFSISRNDIRLPQGEFDTNVFRSRLSYSFTPSMYIQGLIQYNSVLDVWSTNFRFGLLNQANSGLFIVYNDSRGELGINNRSFIIKYSYLFDVYN